MRERKNVYKLSPTDDTLKWYGQAVLEMKARPTKDPRSWNYQAGMHNYDPNSPYWQEAGELPGIGERREFWNQCQHNSWFFLPWHRMYLAFFEEIVAQTIVELGGPADWALPFWDYSDGSDIKFRSLPVAFTTPSNAVNGLWSPGRRNIPLRDNDVSISAALEAEAFSGTGRTSRPSFGGGESTPVNHGSERGQVENTPHATVHGALGGAMGNPATAGLDPIFWLHHANIDRLWQVWLNQGNRVNPTKSSWIDVKFSFHDKDGKKVEMKCIDVVDSRNVVSGYTYEGVASTDIITESLELSKIDFSMPLEIVAATNKQVTLGPNRTTVQLNLTPPPDKVPNFESILESMDVTPTTILHFENVTGKGVPPTQDIYLNVPDEAGDKKSHYAGSINLFGLEQASTPNLHHPGSGQHLTLDVSHIMNGLRSLPNWDEKKLAISIEPAWEMEEEAQVNIGRISLYSE